MGNKIILVTGAAGSIGSALCRRLIKLKPKKLLMLDQDETGIFELEEELKDRKALGIIANIRDKERIREVFKIYKPQIVFHAAAMKHIVMCERFRQEAVKTNIGGTKNLIEESYGCEKFILISSDKAVNPISVMGITKKQAEREIELAQNFKTKFIIVRFGNVMASRGSVIPIWQKQIQENKNLTVTHKDMKRYFMGIYDAVNLVIRAAIEGNDKEIFILDMGQEVLIEDLAKMVIKLSGKDLNIVYTQKEEAEKFSEVLMDEEEKQRSVKKDGLYVIRR